MKAALVGLTALVGIIALAPERASAVTVTNLGLPPSLNAGLAPSGVPTQTGQINVASNPWGPSNTSTSWWYAGDNNSNIATFSFATPQTAFELLWGSPNLGNEIQFFSTQGASVPFLTVTSNNPNDPSNPPAPNSSSGFTVTLNGITTTTLTPAVPGLGPNTDLEGDLILISLLAGDGSFEKVQLDNNGPSAFGRFEFSDVSAVPLPATWSMMLIGFAGLGFLAYRKRNNRLTEIAA